MMHASFTSLVRSIEAIEAMVANRAFAGAAAGLHTTEHALDAYLEAAQRHPHVGCEVSTEVLWKLFMRLRGAVEARSGDAVGAAATDLKHELWVHQHGRADEGLGTAP